MKPISNRRQSAAFTLIELLVTIGIIAILAGLSGSAYTKMMAKANETKCSSNLRQIATAVQLFAAENEGNLPRAKILPAESGYTADLLWSKQLAPYLPLKGTSPVSGAHMVTICPGARYKGFNTLDLASTLSCTAALYSTASFTSPASNGSSDSPPRQSRRLIAIESPAQTPLVVEGKQTPSYNACQSNISWPEASAEISKSKAADCTLFDFRHDNKMNVLYADGHVSSLAFQDRATITREIWNGRY